MLTAAFWGLVQGLTEFLPISSSGHLVLVPALLGMDEPGLATTAILHLGTLAAVVWYYRRDVARLITEPRSDASRRIWLLLVIGTIPAAVIGIALHDQIDEAFSEPRLVAGLLIATGLVLVVGQRFLSGRRRLEEGRLSDAGVVGAAQAIALLPGISRSGMTIVAGAARGLDQVQAARYGFLLAIPAILGAGTLEAIDLVRSGGFESSLLVGAAVAAVTGYAAIAALVRLLGRFGLAPYAAYCIGFGAVALVLV